MSSFGPEDINRAHNYSDVDTGDFAQHHTLGYGANQAAPGLSTNRRLSDLGEEVSYLTNEWIPLEAYFNLGFSSYNTSGWEPFELLHLGDIAFISGTLRNVNSMVGGTAYAFLTLPVTLRPVVNSGFTARIINLGASVNILTSGVMQLTPWGDVGAGATPAIQGFYPLQRSTNV